jgi:preprotein translocase subunit SecB
MSMNEQPTFKRLHAIQLSSVKVVELFIKSNRPPDASIEAEGGDFNFSSAHSSYDPESKIIRVTVAIEIGMEDKPKTPFSMKIRLVGFFKVDEDKFNITHIGHWAEHNAPMILFPYIREHAFALSARCGFRPVLLPLLEVPTLISKARKSVSKKKMIAPTENNGIA